MRDNFSAKVIRDLERRVNGKCSNPDHRVPTSGPTGAREDSVNIGVAAHICAAAPGGPRFDQGMTKADRSDITNGIWLCQNCASLIDRDVPNYPVAVLKRWRESAEIRAKEELGQIPISRERYEAMHAVVFANDPRRGSPDPVATMCRLTAESLQREDPRFQVEVERTRNGTTYTYLAREAVECSLSVRSDRTAEFAEKLSMLLRHGHELTITSSAIVVEGSPLFKQFTGDNGVFVMSPAARRAASVLVELVDDADNKTFFSEITGELAPGSQTLRFQGSGLNGLFKLELDLPRAATTVHVNITLDFCVWDATELSMLPNFAKIWSYYECARAGRKIKLTVEIQGHHLATLEGQVPNNEINNFALLAYIRNARIISAALAQTIYFASNAKISWEEFDAVNELRLRVGLKNPKELSSNPTLSLIAPPGEGIDYVREYLASTVGALTIEQEWDPLKLFDQSIPPLKLITIFSHACLKQIGELDELGVIAELVPLASCTLSCSIQPLD